MSDAFRLSSGGRLDRRQILRFTFDGRSYQGFSGDTLASALLANGVHLVARSFKYHRNPCGGGRGAERTCQYNPRRGALYAEPAGDPGGAL